ncbi:MAG: hypothetical protein ABJB49_08895, partial [Nitrospirota bacterium]
MKERKAKTAAEPTRWELLLEIGTEELPAQFVAPALAELKQQAVRLFELNRLGLDLSLAIRAALRLG